MTAFTVTSAILFAAVSLFSGWIVVECYRTRNEPPYDGGSEICGTIAAGVCIVFGSLAIWGIRCLVF